MPPEIPTGPGHDSELVEAARRGNPRAREELARAYLPLVHSLVGRALNGHSDVDDIVQETMMRALGGLHTLRDPARFRSWLVAIAMNQVRRHQQDRAAAPGLQDAHELADPGADFVDLTILRLNLQGQRREVAEATRWLDEDDRSLLSLWWLESAGELTRAEVAEALGLGRQHTAVRVQRMKERLETSRLIVRALATGPRCGALADTLGIWDGAPSPLWRKRIARHLRSCPECDPAQAGAAGMLPPERLLRGLGIVPVGVALAATVRAPAPDGLTTTGAQATHPSAAAPGPPPAPSP
ncbi:RNA polymerase sigma factor, partial [Streptomyces sp. NRRL S-1868]|uniref:RNA polymerase sigma factor n=1 Tax=Streptomyces sp. NRRL S-1868 TaxID=1463892 RepID=UPI001F33A328